MRRYVGAIRFTQRQLALSEERYRRLFHYAHDPIMLFNSKGCCIDANPQAEALTGYSRHQLLDLHFSKLGLRLSPRDTIHLLKQIKKKGFIRQKTAVTRQDGTIRWIEYTLAQDAAGDYPVIVRDVTAQKKQIETLQRAALIFQHLTVGILVTDEAGHITDINPAAEKMFGYSKEEMIGQSTGVLYDLQLKKSREAIMTGLQKTGYWQGEIRFLRKNSQVGVCERVVVPLLDNHNRMIGRISINQDITDRKKAEIKLRQKNAELEAIFRAMPDLYFRLDDAGQFLDVKPNFHGDLFLPPEEIIYNHVESVFSSNTAAQFREAITQALATKVVTNVEYSSPSNSKTYEARLSALNEYEVVALCRDITEYKQAETRLKLQSTLLASISEASLDGIFVGSFVSSKECKCIYYNRNFLKMWSLPEIDLEKSDCREIAEDVYTQVSNPAKCRDDFERLMPNNEEVNRSQVSLIDGRIFDRYTAPLVDDQTYFGRVWYYRDITEHLKLETQLQQSQKMEAIGRLAGGVAHDFNNILTIIIGNLEFLMDSTPDLSSSVRQDLDTVKAAAQRAAKLTAQLLAFSRQQVIKAQAVALNDLIQGIARLLEGMIGDDITLELSLKANPDWVIFDPNQFEQVLFNLVANARDAMPAGGRIVIATDTISASLHPEEKDAATETYVRFTVSDTGQGIDSQVQAKIFDPFFTTKAPGKGTGLGLSIVYGIVTQYGGQIECESRPHQGTTFNILLPIMNSEQSLPINRNRVQKVSKAQSYETIMVVDDDDEVRELIIKILKRHGYKIVDARNGVEALATLESNAIHVDLLLTDVMMPEIYGPELAERIRTHQPDLKVLYLSGFTTKVLTRWKLTPQQILNKPFSVTTLVNRVQEVLDISPKG
ncbi:MAG: PAS domain S-box protein [Anaerolineae bacterium]|nr:PAS domain S-box protein [Anaerolineae bacterium]